jgi:hypothetical protein
MKLIKVSANQTEIELADGTTVFFSYKTPVAAHIPGLGYFKSEKRWSVTTSKHIGQFIARNGGSGAVTTKPQAWFDTLALAQRVTL